MRPSWSRGSLQRKLLNTGREEKPEHRNVKNVPEQMAFDWLSMHGILISPGWTCPWLSSAHGNEPQRACELPPLGSLVFFDWTAARRRGQATAGRCLQPMVWICRGRGVCQCLWSLGPSASWLPGTCNPTGALLAQPEETAQDRRTFEGRVGDPVSPYRQGDRDARSDCGVSATWDGVSVLIGAGEESGLYVPQFAVYAPTHAHRDSTLIGGCLWHCS